MCGVAGIIGVFDADAHNRITSALDALKTRGDDERDIWKGNRVVLGHTRLSIRGTINSKQPITDKEGIVTICVNGEIYIKEGFQSLYNECGYTPLSNSDSEVIIALYLKYGLDGMLSRLRGEYAFCLYDHRSRMSYLVRDRFGIKPLCYYKSNNCVMFASKAKGLFAMGVHPQFDIYSLSQVISMQYNPADRTMFDGIWQVEPGHYIAVTPNGETTDVMYWDVQYPTSAVEYDNRPEKEIFTEFKELLEDSVKLRLQSLTTPCCHLSGGLDSSTVAGIMASNMTKLDCYTITFPDMDEEYDETKLARQTATKIGATLHEIPMSSDDIMRTLKSAVFYSEGVCVNGHISCKYMLNKRIHEDGFKVALTGEGADECLCGYPHLRRDLIVSLPPAEKELYMKRLYSTNTAITGTEIACDASLNTSFFLDTYGYVPSFIEAKSSIGMKMSHLLRQQTPISSENIYKNVCNKYGEYNNQGVHNVNRSVYLWNKMTLPNYILGTLGDGCEMSHQVEGRLPFLDHKLFEFAAKLPIHLKIKDIVNEKYILKECAKPYITDTVYNRQKHPFQAPPLTRFFNEGILNEIRDELTASDCSNLGIFDVAKISSMLDMLAEADVMTQTIYEPVVMLLLSIRYLQTSYLL